MDMKNQGRFQITLRPECGGSYTRVRLIGSVPTSPQSHLLQMLARSLHLWSGYRSECVLCADAESLNWLCAWLESMGGIPEGHLQRRIRWTRSRGAR